MKRAAAALDAGLAAAGVAMGAFSLAYPFGCDTAVHYYVGREWLLRGAIPYRDVFDHKTPGIYVLHALCVALFGERMIGIRLAELVCATALGLLCGLLVTGRARRPSPGVLGASVLAANVFYYGYFDFANTAQCELWGVSLVVGAFAAADMLRRPHTAAWVSGLLLGAATLMKPPMALFGVIAVVALWRRSRGSPWPLLAAQLAAAAAPWALTLGYLAAHDALAPAYELVVRANAYYLEHEPAHVGPIFPKIAKGWGDVSPSASAVLVAAALGAACNALVRRPLWRKYGVPAVLFAITVLLVAAQRKFYEYHWSTLVAPFAMAVASVTEDATNALRARKWAGLVPVAIATSLLFLWTQSGLQFQIWSYAAHNTLAWVEGRCDRATFVRAFYGVGYDYADREDVGLWLRAHSSPGDTLLVRGMEPEIYAVSGLHAPPDRFFWTLWLSVPTREYHREQWLREDTDAIARYRPRWVVALAPFRDGPDSVAWFAPFGYVVRKRVDDLVVLEHTRSPSGPSARREGAG